MKKFLIILFLFFNLTSEALTRYLVAGGTGNWNSTTNWSASSGGASGASFPVAGDDVNIDAGSGTANITVNVASACATVTIANSWAGTWTQTSTIATTGNVTWGSGMTFSGTGNWLLQGGGTITSNGKVFPGGMVVSGVPFTITLADDLTLAGAFTHTTTAATLTINSNNFNARGNWSQSSTRLVAGSATVNFVGTSGTSTLSNTGGISNNVVFNSSNTISISSWTQSGGTLTYTAGTISGTGALGVSGAATINTSGMTWPDGVNILTTSTITLASNLNLIGDFNGGVSGVATINGAFNINAGGGNTTSNCTVTGTVSGLVLNGTGTIQNASGSGNWQIPITINTAGTVTIGANLRMSGASITYTSGTVITTSSTLTISNSTTLNTSGINWNNISCITTTPLTLTLSSNLSVLGTFTSSSINLVFAGNFDVTMGTLAFTTGNNLRSITFVSGRTYTITTAMTCVGPFTSTNTQTYKASTAGVAANLVLLQGATQDNMFLDAIDIYSADGQTIWTYKGTIGSNVTNWRVLPTQPQTITTSN